MKQIEEITESELQEIWPLIGGEPHLFEYGKDELKQVITTGDCAIEYMSGKKLKVEPCGIQLDFYTMAAIVDYLRSKGYETPSLIADNTQLLEQAAMLTKLQLENERLKVAMNEILLGARPASEYEAFSWMYTAVGIIEQALTKNAL